MSRSAGRTPIGAGWRVDELAGDPVEIAPRLLGSLIVTDEVTLRITEVEAYRGADDPGSHGFRGRTPRTDVMFGPAGRLYVYFTFGMHWCANVVCGTDGTCAAVLLRAGEVVGGIATARQRRPGVRDRDLARGPARLTRTLALDGGDDGSLLVGPDAAPALLHPGGPASALSHQAVRRGPRVGVSGPGGDGETFPWRFWLADEPTVSPYRAARPRRPRT